MDYGLLYRDMLLIRSCEERAAALYTEGLISGFCHLYIGQEAVVTGVNHVLDKSLNSQITGYRDHAHMIACGVEPKFVLAELCGKATGASGGKGGSMHMYSRENNFYGGHGIVGSQVSIGTGIAFAHKYKNDGGICAIYFGDGAANQGQVYESFNMASLWKLPAMFILEDNKYAMGTSVTRSASCSDIGARCEGFGIPQIDVDGMDVLDVIEKTKQGYEYIKNGNGPILLHMDTYRYRGHSMSDPCTYRTRSEVDDVKKNRDPIARLAKHLEQNIIDDIENEVNNIMDDAVKFAIDSPVPSSDELYTNVYDC